MRIGENINKFDLTDNTVKSFNEIFTKSKLSLAKFNENDIVEIGDIHSTGTVRYITVNGTQLILDLSGETERNKTIINPVVLLYNDSEEKVLMSKKLACEYLGIGEDKLNIMRSYNEQFKGYFVEFKERDEYIN